MKDVGTFYTVRLIVSVDYRRPCLGPCVALRKYKGTRNLDRGGDLEIFLSHVTCLDLAKRILHSEITKENMLMYVFSEDQ